MEKRQKVSAPVLLIGFNRPDTMQQVFDAVRIAKPEKLYYAVDGARPDKGEEDRVQQVRDIVKQVDWPCEVHTLFREKNVGCGFGPAGAITWAFENEDRLIVLEDDCVPSQSFFRFCNEMLELYKDDERVNIVSGRSHHAGTIFFEKQDYIFTHYAHTWGWATWKRSWNEFDIYMKDVPEWLSIGGYINTTASKKIGKRNNQDLLKKYIHIDSEVSHSWDTQWSYTRHKTGGLGIVPCRNLIHNIGEMGTHSFGHTATNDLLAEELPLELRHPKFIVINAEYELFHYKYHVSKKSSLVKRIIGKIRREGLVNAIRNFISTR